MNELNTKRKASSFWVLSTYKVSRLTWLQWLLFLIPLAYILILMIIPAINLFKLSIFDKDGFTLEYIGRIFKETVYLEVLWITFKIAFIVTIVSLLLAYPVAYLLVKINSSFWKKVIIAAVLIPFWISLLVRTFSWTIILQDQGIVNKILIGIGLINNPLPLLYNTTGVVIGMTHVLLPYMVLSLYAVMEGIDQRLIQAAEGLGARPSKAFLQVFLPLSIPGVLSGSLLVFILGLGYFITPALLGGTNTMMISMLIQSNIITTLNWHLASALSIVLFVVTMILLAISYLLLRRNPVIQGVS